MSSLTLAVGQKVLLNDGRSATIRFKGTTSFAAGDWVGVELEDATGKNDGAVQGQRYFDCDDGHGMFLRSTGVSKIVAQPAAKANRQSTGPAAKNRLSTVGASSRQSLAAPGGRSRESILASPTPSRGLPSRASGVKSPIASPTKATSIAGSSASSRTSTPSVAKTSVTSTVRSRTSLAPATSTASRRTSTLPSTSASATRAPPRVSLAGVRSGARPTPTASARGGSGAATSTTITTRLSGASEDSSHDPVIPEEPDASSDGRSAVFTPDSEVRNGVSNGDGSTDNESRGGEGSEQEDMEATPKPLRAAYTTTQPASRAASMQSISPTISAASMRPSTARSAANSSREIEDLQTKLRVLEKRRLEDRERLKTLERLQQERDRFESIITRLQQKYQPQQQELAELKRQVKEQEARFATVENLQTDFDVELENATLDREMAEEQLEVAKTELAALRDKYEEAELELEVLRDENQELGKEMSPEERTSQGWLQLERSNERYREALIRLRDITQEQESELRQQIATLEKELEELTGIKDEADELKAKMLEGEAAIEDLKQQLELAEGGEEMLEELSERNMALQERIEDLSATIDDLENLKELNDELEVNHIEAEKGMQEEIDFKDSVISEQLRRAQEQQKAVDDYETTVARFREAFRSLQADLEDMRASKEITDTEAQDLNSKSRALIDLNMKLQSSAAKTQIKTLDLELQRLEAEEATQHLAIIRIFLPESYQADRDAVLALLRCKRIAFKANLIHGTIRERLADHTGDDLFVGFSVLDRLAWIRAMSQCFINGINASSADSLSRFEGALHELEPIERGFNSYIEMLRREDFQMKRVDTELERSIAVMDHLGSTILEPCSRMYADQVVMKTSLLQSHLETAALALAMCKSFVEKHSASVSNGHNGEAADEDNMSDGDATPDFAPFFSRIEALTSQARGAKVIASKAHRELEELRSRSMSLPQDTENAFDSAVSTASQIALFTRTVGSRLASLDDPTTDQIRRLTPQRVVPILTSSANEIFAPSASESAPFSTLHTRLTSLTSSLSDLYALTTDVSRASEFTLPPPPWEQRALQLAATAKSSSADKAEVARLGELLRERNLSVREREAALDEQGVRIEMLEARMGEATRRGARVAELEEKLAAGSAEMSRLRSEFERVAKEAKRLREERDALKAKVGASEDRNGPAGAEDGHEVGDRVVGRAARLELERRRVQVEGLRATVRFLHDGKGLGTSTNGGHVDGGHEWLRRPLVPSLTTPADSSRDTAASLLERKSRDVLLSLLELATADEDGTSSAGPVRILTREAGERLKWAPARETNPWRVARRREEYALWQEWRAQVEGEAGAFGRRYGLQ